MTPASLPDTQHAILLVGPDRLELTSNKPVPRPGPHEVLARVEAVGLCFSDLKLLARFDAHPRKGPVRTGLDARTLDQIQSYVPNLAPTVPGHEVACRIVAVGDEVSRYAVGERCLVQTDYRDLETAESNAAFGYNFEGGLQQYVILDERVAVSRVGDRYLIPVADTHSASAIALVEPWACVEDSYLMRNRRGPQAGGRLIVVADHSDALPGLDAVLAEHQPRAVTRISEPEATNLGDHSCDDIVYHGASPATVERLDRKLAAGGLLNVVLGGRRLGRRVELDVGRIHYGGTRWVGTLTDNVADGYARVPPSGELRPGDQILIVGAGGPMGQMHALRAQGSGLANIGVVATDFDDVRRAALADRLGALAAASGVSVQTLDPRSSSPPGPFTYFVLMVPAPALVQQAIEQAGPDAIINVFAGIPAGTATGLDFDAYLEKGCYALGTSGSVIEDMRVVLDKLEAGTLDTNRSVWAVAGMAGAVAGIRAVKDQTVAGKIVVYPELPDLELTPLAELGSRFPTVAAKLDAGAWSLAAERELLRIAATPRG